MKAPLLGLLVVAACRAPAGPVEEPPLVMVTREGEVRGWEKERVERYAALLVELAPAVRAQIHVDPDPARIWLDREEFIDGSPGMLYSLDDERWIVFGSKADGNSREYVAHELAHWYAFQEPWRHLPAVLEEAFALWVAATLTDNLEQLRNPSRKEPSIVLARAVDELGLETMRVLALQAAELARTETE